jgi:hypothetical protein
MCNGNMLNYAAICKGAVMLQTYQQKLLEIQQNFRYSLKPEQSVRRIDWENLGSFVSGGHFERIFVAFLSSPSKFRDSTSIIPRPSLLSKSFPILHSLIIHPFDAIFSIMTAS